MALLAPARLVLTPSVLQVEHGEALLRRLGSLALQFAVSRWQIDHGALHSTRTGRWEQHL